MQTESPIPSRWRFDLSGYWQGSLKLNPSLDVAAPETVTQDFYLPLPWNVQVESLKWPGPDQELSGVVTPIQNQNFREWQRKFSEGVIVYRRAIVCHPPAGRRVFLVIEGSNYRTTARLNGQRLGTHDGGHLAFEFEVTDSLRPGENAIEITVDNLRRRDACPQEPFNWQNYGGVYRPFYLEARPERHIRSVAVQPGQDAEGWYADVSVTLNETMHGRVRVDIHSGDTTAATHAAVDGAACHTRVRMPARPLIWQPGTGGSSRFEVRLTTAQGGVDAYGGEFGFRGLAFSPNGLSVNGKPMRILGAALHEQHPAFGNAVPGWQARRDLQMMKYVGFNTVRAAHYPHSQGFYDACDREGMLCLAEMPCWQFTSDQFESKEVLESCLAMATEMVDQLGNHPSIVGWIVQNESKTTEPGAIPFFEAIARRFKQLDPARFTMTAENGTPPEHLAVVKEAKALPTVPPPTHACVDVLGVNDYAGWYGEKADYLPRLLDRIHELLPSKPLLVSEFGGEGILGQRSLTMAPWTEDYQAEILCRHVLEILRRPHMAGFLLWLFADYECASIGIRALNAKGLVDEFRRPKLAFNRIKALLEEHASDSH